MIKNICLNCGKEIIAKYNYPRKYCSDKCLYMYKREKILKKAKEKYIPRITFIKSKEKCLNCGITFIKNQPNHIYCSKNCGVEYYKKNSNLYNTLLKMRFELFKRDNFQCQYCGRTPVKDKCKLVIDHIIPRNLYGTNDVTNLITCCEECNLGKSDILLSYRKILKEVKNE
jgi:hypothetical protein